MKIKALKFLITISILFSAMPVFSQDQKTADSLINKYNHWLKLIQLDKIIQASAIIKPGEQSLKNDVISAGALPNRWVLILKTTGDFKDPQDAATGWSYIANHLKKRGLDIYLLMLNELANESSSALPGVQIICKSVNNNFFSLNFYFDGTLNISKNIINEVMGGEVSLNFDFDKAIKDATSGEFQLDKADIDLTRYYPSLKRLLGGFRHERDSVIRCHEDIVNKYVIKVNVFNLYGQITNASYHERLRLLIMVSNTAKNHLQVYYNLYAKCAGGIFVIPRDDKQYANVEEEYPEKLAMFNHNFSEMLKKILNEK